MFLSRIFRTYSCIDWELWEETQEAFLGVWLRNFHPDFISVTYGAGGTNRKNNAEIAGYIKSLGIEPLAHLTGGPSNYDDIDSIAKDLKSKNVENILACIFSSHFCCIITVIISIKEC